MHISTVLAAPAPRLRPVLKVGVVGLGRWGGNLLRVCAGSPAFEVVAVCDERPEALSGDLGFRSGAEPFASLEGLLRGVEVDAVVIATPPQSHAELVRAALLAGKHVFVEKPFATSVSDARELAALAEAQGTQLMVGHILRFHPAILRARRLLSGGRLGRLMAIEASRSGRAAEPIVALWSLLPHDISLLYGFGLREFGEVSARPRGDGGVEVLLSCSGVRVQLSAGPTGAQKQRFLKLLGDEGELTFNDGAALELKQAGGRLRRVGYSRAEPLALELEYFARGVAEGRLSQANAAEGVFVTEVLAAAEAALRETAGSFL